MSAVSIYQGRRHGATIGGGGDEGHLNAIDSFHAPPIGIMLNAEKFAGDRSPVPPVPPPMQSTKTIGGGGRAYRRSSKHKGLQYQCLKLPEMMFPIRFLSLHVCYRVKLNMNCFTTISTFSSTSVD